MSKKMNKADKAKKAAAEKKKRAAIAKAVAEKAAKNPDAKKPAKKAKKDFSFKAIRKWFSTRQGLTAIVAALAVMLVIAVVVLIVVSNDKKEEPKGPHIKISEDFDHEAPEGMNLDDAITLVNEDTAKDVVRREGVYSSDAEPVAYDKGWYVFDEDGYARKYRDMDGNVHALPENEWYTDPMRGDPLELLGSVSIQFVVYPDGDNVACCYHYYVLTDPADMDIMLSAMNRMGFGGDKVTKMSDTVIEVLLDQEAVQEEFTVQVEDVTADPAADVAEVTVDEYLKYLEERYGAKQK